MIRNQLGSARGLSISKNIPSSILPRHFLISVCFEDGEPQPAISLMGDGRKLINGHSLQLNLLVSTDRNRASKVIKKTSNGIRVVVSQLLD